MAAFGKRLALICRCRRVCAVLMGKAKKTGLGLWSSPRGARPCRSDHPRTSPSVRLHHLRREHLKTSESLSSLKMSSEKIKKDQETLFEAKREKRKAVRVWEAGKRSEMSAPRRSPALRERIPQQCAASKAK